MREAKAVLHAYDRRVLPTRAAATTLLVILAIHAAAGAGSTMAPDMTSDLVVQRVEYMDCVPRVGVTVYNQGNAAVVTPFDVRLTSTSANGPTSNAVQSVGGLGAFSSTRVVFGLASHDIWLATADPLGLVNEANDRNNELKVAADTLVPCPTISMSDGAAVQGSSVRIAVRISHAFTQPVRASYVTDDGSAVGADFGLVARGATTCSGDFIRRRGTVEFPAGTSELVQFIEVATCVDGTAEAREQFSVRLTEIVNGRLTDAAEGVAVAQIENGAL